MLQDFLFFAIKIYVDQTDQFNCLFSKKIYQSIIADGKYQSEVCTKKWGFYTFFCNIS